MKIFNTQVLLRKVRQLRLLAVILLFSLLGISSCYTTYHPVKSEHSYIRIDQRITVENEEVKSLILPYKQALENEMGTVLANLETGLSRQKPESTLGNLLADILQEQAELLTGRKIDFAVQNYGGIRIGQVPAGPVTKGKIYEVMPFENYLLVLEVPGKDLELFAKKMIEYGGWPVSQGIRISGKENKLISLEIGGKPVLPDQIYNVAMPDYIADGGDNCFFFVGKPRVNTGVLIRDGLVNWFAEKGKAGQIISGKLDGRFELE
jgi:2',3'-cyclic-nucleotide 2'-phosphodiesterase (5'-nucleotidase family)